MIQTSTKPYPLNQLQENSHETLNSDRQRSRGALGTSCGVPGGVSGGFQEPYGYVGNVIVAWDSQAFSLGFRRSE